MRSNLDQHHDQQIDQPRQHHDQDHLDSSMPLMYFLYLRHLSLEQVQEEEELFEQTSELKNQQLQLSLFVALVQQSVWASSLQSSLG
jgi:hypothetical protein